ncbi:MAG: glycoside hydrolase family 2 [Pirellulales bacterium]|nr:glycoside hydrolase family 2 [Pirellulales bacterium]
MASTVKRLAVLPFILFGLSAAAWGGGPAAWPEITRECRPGAYWWWMGSAVNPADLTRELARYCAAGMGGVHIVPIYGAKGCEDQYIEYLSPKWMAMMHHAVREAERLDMFVDMSLGTGWCFGGPNVSDEDACANIKVNAFDAPADSRWTHSFDPKALQVLAAFAPDGKWIDLKEKLDSNGAITWRSDGVPRRIYAVLRRLSGRKVKRAAPGGEGWMLDPFSGGAVRRYLERFTEAFAANPGPRPRAYYHDSYEFIANWSPDLLDEFAERRGYRLEGELPALLAKEPDDHAARVKADYRETVSDMMIENYAPVWIGWSRDHGSTTRYQAHGSPANILDLYALADVPETEMYAKDRDVLVAKFASSAAHVAGRKLTAAETGTWLKEHFITSLADVKKLADELFLAGVNHVIYHGACYSPDEAPWPGWLFYASTQMNPRNSIWRDAPALNAYIARCQAVLQAGRPGNDILLYWPIHDLWNGKPGNKTDDFLPRYGVHNSRSWLDERSIGAVATLLWKRGYRFDYVSDRQLVAAQVNQGRATLPGGEYATVLVPPCNLMPLETLKALFDLAEAGATVIFADHLPKDVPGAGNLDKRRSQFAETLKRVLFTQPTTDGTLQTASVGSGRLLVGPIEAGLAAAGVDREALTDLEGLQFIRRTLDDGYWYFLNYRGRQPIDGWIPLSVDCGAIAIHDPMTGQIGTAATRNIDSGRTEVYLRIEPGESVILRAFADRPATPTPQWDYYHSSGEPVELTGKWKIEFIEGGPKLPHPLATERLVSWTELEDEVANNFAGAARYTLVFDAPETGRSTWLLDLGRVCHSARVRLNGRDLGTVFAPPFRVLADRLQLKPLGNVLEVEATNLSANRIRDMDRRGERWKNFHDINFVSLDGKPFNASNWPLYDSGLLGPVRLRKQESFQP